jgi:hypothetical protein
MDIMAALLLPPISITCRKIEREPAILHGTVRGRFGLT